MNAIRSVLRSLSSWRLWVAALAAATVGLGGYLAFYEWSDSNSPGNSGQTQLVPVTRGNLVNDVSVTGTLAYANRETVTFRQQGFVSDISTSEGDWVRTGDSLAVLDDETIANLDRAVAQARIEVRDTEEALEEAMNPHKAAQIAQAELDAANARLNLQKAEEELQGLAEVPEELLAQAQVDVVKAQILLEDATEDKSTLMSPSFQVVAKAQSQFTAARLALRDAQEDLEALLNPTETEMAQAEAEVTRSQIQLEDAREALESVTSVTALDLAKARAAVSDAELEYMASQDAIYELETWSVAGDILNLQESIDAAQDSLLTAKEDLQNAERNSDSAVQAATDEVKKSKSNYSGLFEEWLGIDVFQLSGHSPDAVLAELGIDLGYVFGDGHMAELQSQYEEGTLEDSHSTPWNEQVVHSRTELVAGEVMVECDWREAGAGKSCVMEELMAAFDTVKEKAAGLDYVRAEEAEKVGMAEESVYGAERALEQADRNLDVYITEQSESESTLPLVRSRVEALGLAKANLENAREELSSLLAAPDAAEVESRQQDITAAEIALADSLEKLSSLTGQPDALILESKTRAVETAEADLLDAESALAELLEAADLDVELADSEVELSRAMLQDAEDALSSLLEDPDAIELLVKQANVRVARESLAEAESALAEFRTVDLLEIGLREAELVAARTSLETAVTDLERATLRAPFDGVVASVNIEVGQQVNVSTQAIEIADPSIVEVSGSVDEIDVLFLRVGAQAFVSLDALAGQILPGTVSTVANAGTSQQGVVTYPVTVRVDSSESGRLPEGLSATAQIIIREQSDAILIPLQALYGTVQAPLVKVVVDEALVERQVGLGISDDFWVVIEEGLSEGEVVSMDVVGSGTSQFGGFGPGFRQIGGINGGFGGGGGGLGGGGNR